MEELNFSQKRNAKTKRRIICKVICLSTWGWRVMKGPTRKRLTTTLPFQVAQSRSKRVGIAG
jgi:hypothetical protein